MCSLPLLCPERPLDFSGFLSGALWGCFVMLTAMVRGRTREPEDSWLILHILIAILIFCDWWRFTWFLAEKHWISRLAYSGNLVNISPHCLSDSQLPSLPYVVVNFPTSFVNSTGHTANFHAPPPQKKQKTELLERPLTLVSQVLFTWHCSRGFCEPLVRIIWCCTIWEAEQQRAGETSATIQCNPLIFHTRPKEAPWIAQGHRVNYGRTGSVF